MEPIFFVCGNVSTIISYGIRIKVVLFVYPHHAQTPTLPFQQRYSKQFNNFAESYDVNQT